MLYDQRWDAKQQEQIPTFERRWWHRASGLDIRPMLWSLRNRPEEWSAPRDGFTIKHDSSNHEFWVGNGFWFYSLYSADCSCTSERNGTFSFIQKLQFGRAYRAWRRAYMRPIEQQRTAEINRQFAEHFLTSRNG